MFPVSSVDCGPPKNVIMYICLSCCFLCFSFSKSKDLQWVCKEGKFSSWEINLSGDNFVSGRGAVDLLSAMMSSITCSLSLVLPEALAGAAQDLGWSQVCCVFAFMAGCIGRDFWTWSLVPWNFYKWHYLSSVTFFLFSARKLEDASEELWAKC